MENDANAMRFFILRFLFFRGGEAEFGKSAEVS